MKKMPQVLLGMEVKDLQEYFGPGHAAYRARQVYDAVYRRKIQSVDQISNLPAPLRAKLQSEATLGLPELDHVYRSIDGTKRYLLKLQDGKTVETVLMPETGRHTICISSQVGCPVDCRFCLTALLGLERSLTAGEIVGQVLYVIQDNGLEIGDSKLNLVMMGMGEPLLNLPAVLKASRILLSDDGVGLSPRRMTLSTSGITPRLKDLAAEPLRPKLAISLNASHEEQRRELMPITRKYHLQELLDACRAYPLRPWEMLTFEYVLLSGVNDADADARRVVSLLANLKCKVNLIALNPGPGIDFRTPSPERVDSFQTIVRRSLPCFVRKPRGLDIYAACGQLKRTTDLVAIQPEHASV